MKFSRLLERVVRKMQKRSLPSEVQGLARPSWRPPVSSTESHWAPATPARRTASASLMKGSLPCAGRRLTWRPEMSSPKPCGILVTLGIVLCPS